MSLYNSFSKTFDAGHGKEKTINTMLFLFWGNAIGYNNILNQLTGQAMGAHRTQSLFG
jgi:hypothetical protein